MTHSSASPTSEPLLLPLEKVTAVCDQEATGRTVQVISDGINDAPALVAAHTGIAMGRAGCGGCGGGEGDHAEDDGGDRRAGAGGEPASEGILPPTSPLATPSRTGDRPGSRTTFVRVQHRKRPVPRIAASVGSR
ncbi:hypothetical protein GCM10010193_06730 [Kitasatospora atroaurantiaca]